MLNAVVVYGTGRRAALPDQPAAGKTGTTQDFRDAWFVGYTSQLTAGVWIGNDDGKPMNRATGGSLPAEIWNQVMRVAHEGKAPSPLPGTVIRLGLRPTRSARGLRPRLPGRGSFSCVSSFRGWRGPADHEYICSGAYRFRWCGSRRLAKSGIAPGSEYRRRFHFAGHRRHIKWSGVRGKRCRAGAGQDRARIEAAR